VSRAVKIPVIGLGGIVKAEDAIQYLLAGASAIQVGTALFSNPNVVNEVLKGIEQWMLLHNVLHVSAIKSMLHE